jgi:hypothetical protein
MGNNGKKYANIYLNSCGEKFDSMGYNSESGPPDREDKIPF